MDRRGVLRGGAVPQLEPTCQRHDRTAESTGFQSRHLFHQPLSTGCHRALPIGQSETSHSEAIGRARIIA